MMSGMSLFLLRLFLKQCVWIIRSQYFLWHWLLLDHFCLHLRLNNLLYLSCLPHAIAAVIWHIRLLHACTVCMLNALELLLFRKLWGVALAFFFFLFYFSRLSSSKDSCLSLFQCSCLFVLVVFFGWESCLPCDLDLSQGVWETDWGKILEEAVLSRPPSWPRKKWVETLQWREKIWSATQSRAAPLKG